MTKISILKDYKMFDVGSRSNVDKIISLISIADSQVTLDVSRCIIDYPATSLLIDKILFDLSKSRKRNKELTIVTNLSIAELLLLHWLFIGSVFFDVNDSACKNDLEEFKTLITDKLQTKKISLTLAIVDKKDTILKTYSYGK